MKPLHIVVNAGNGCANIAFAELKKHLPFTFTELYMEPDGRFPHGVPNPMLEECQKPLKEKVLEEKQISGSPGTETLTVASSSMKMGNS